MEKADTSCSAVQLSAGSNISSDGRTAVGIFDVFVYELKDHKGRGIEAVDDERSAEHIALMAIIISYLHTTHVISRLVDFRVYL